MAKPVYDDGYSEEKSDIADTYEARQERIALKHSKRDLESPEKAEEQTKNEQRGLSEVFFISFPEEAEQQLHLTKQKCTITKKKSIGPSSRQRHQNKKVELTKSFLELVEQNPNKPLKSVSLENQLDNQSQDNAPIPTDLISRIGSVDVDTRRGSFRSFQNFDEESRPPPRNIPAYYEYQQRSHRKRRRRRYIWELAFFGVYRRNTQLDDDIATEILSVATAT